MVECFFEASCHCMLGSQMVDIGIVVPEIDIFPYSTGEFNINTLDHMKKLKNVLSRESPDTLTTIDLAGSQGLEGMRIDTLSLRKSFSSSPLVTVWSCSCVPRADHSLLDFWTGQRFVVH